MVGTQSFLYCCLFIANDVFDICSLSLWLLRNEQVRGQGKKAKKFYVMWRTLTSKGINRMKTWDSKRGKKGARRGNRIRKPLLLLPPHHSSANSTQLLQTSLPPLGKHFSLWIETASWFKKRRKKKFEKLLYFFNNLKAMKVRNSHFSFSSLGRLFNSR